VKRVVWTDPAKSDIRALSRPDAMRVFSVLHRFAQSGVGDVKALCKGERNCGFVSATTACSLSVPMQTASKSDACTASRGAFR